MPEHHKVLEAGAKLGGDGIAVALGVAVWGILTATRNLSDGHLSEAVLERCPVRNRARVKAVMVGAGLWEETAGGVVVHDFLDWNPSAVSVKGKRAADLERKRIPHGIQPESARNPHGIQPESAGIPDASRARDPVPSRPKKNTSAPPPAAATRNGDVTTEGDDERTPPAAAPAPVERPDPPDREARLPRDERTGGFSRVGGTAPHKVMCAMVKSVLAEGGDWTYPAGEADLLEELKTRCAKAPLPYDTEAVRKALDACQVAGARRTTA